MGWPSRTTVMRTTSPGWCFSTSVRSSSTVFTRLCSMATIMSAESVSRYWRIQGVKVRVEQVVPGFVRRSIDPDTADLIVAVDHNRVRTLEELLTEVEKHQPGEVVRITVLRDGNFTDVPVQLGQSS